MTIKEQIINHIKTTGRVPNYSTVGGYEVAKPVFDEMIKDGTLVWGIKLSPKGRKMKNGL